MPEQAEKKRRRAPGAGRPPKFNDLVAQKILTAVRNCNFEKQAAEWAGIDARTLQRWKERGETSRRKADEPFRNFVARLREASRAAEIEAATMAFTAAKWRAEHEHDPKHLIDLLRIRWRQRWNEKHRVQVTNRSEASPEMADAIGDALMEKLKRLAQSTPPLQLRRVETLSLPPAASGG